MIIEHQADGRIMHVMATVPEAYAAFLRSEGKRFIEVARIDVPIETLIADCFVIEGMLAERPDMGVTIDRHEIAADDRDTCTITGLPAPCTIVIEGMEHTVEDGRLDFTADQPGTYAVTLRAWPFKDHELIITAR